MSLIEKLKEKGNKYYERLSWELRYGSPVTWITYPYWWLMERERGLDFPFYFNAEKRFVERRLAIFIEWLNNFVSIHEPERYQGDTSLTLIKRIKYVSNNVIFYTNDTMSNLYYSTQIAKRDLDRLKSAYMQMYFMFFGYNMATGIFLVAINNYFFRNKKATIPVAFIASLTTYFAFSINFKISYYTLDRAFSHQVRRLGYRHLIHNANIEYPRNVDFI